MKRDTRYRKPNGETFVILYHTLEEWIEERRAQCARLGLGDEATESVLSSYRNSEVLS